MRPGISLTLDEYRKLYGELIRDAESACKETAIEHQLPLKLTYNARRGFHLSLSRRVISLKDLPAVFVKVSSRFYGSVRNTTPCSDDQIFPPTPLSTALELDSRISYPVFLQRTTEQASYHFTTELLLQINERMDKLSAVIYDQTMAALSPWLKTIEPFAESLYKIADILSELDVTCSLTVLATCGHGYVRPTFSDTATIIEESRHPVYTRHWSSENQEGFKCNPVYFTSDDNMVVLSGPNNSGKSVYMKQVVLLQVLAQIGSYVPAKWGVFRPAGSIVSRTGHEDDLRSNCSTFMAEVLRIGQMIRHIQEDSLIIIDELGRGTSEEDGSALCFAVGSYLTLFKSFVMLSTHFEVVMQLERFFPNISNRHMKADFNEDNELEYRHTLRSGVSPLSSYGVPVALHSGLSESVCGRAAEVAEMILMDTIPFEDFNKNESLVKLRRQATQLRGKLLFLSEAETKPVALTDEVRDEIRSLANIVRELEERMDMGEDSFTAPAQVSPRERSISRVLMPYQCRVLSEEIRWQ